MRSNLFWLSDEQWRQIDPHLPTDVRGVWERLFRALAARARSGEVEMIDSTHVKAHRSAAGGKGGAAPGECSLARRAQHEDLRTRGC